MSLFAVKGKLRSLVCLVAVLLLPRPAFPVAPVAPGVGSQAPPLQSVDLGGTVTNVVWGAGSPAATIVYFFDPQDAGCLLEMNFLDALYSRGRDGGLAVYAVEARGRQPAEVTRSLERYCQVYRTPAFPVLADPAFRASRTYGAERVPVAFIIAPHGAILDRVEGFGRGEAIAIARRVERQLRREPGFFSPALRDSGVSAADEREAEIQLAAAAAARAGVAALRALDVGDRVPEFEFTTLDGGAGGWDWSGTSARNVRVLAFFDASAPSFIDELNWLDGLARRGREAGLEVLAVEAGGADAAACKLALDKQRPNSPDLSFPVAIDRDGSLARAFGPFGQLPQTYLIGGDQTVVYHAVGFSAREGEIMADKVERSYLLAGRPFPPAPPDGTAVPAAPLEEEAPSIRKRQDPEDRHRSAIALGDAAYLVWEYDRALMHYREALEAQPKDLHALVRAARICERRGEPVPALHYWQRVLAVQPDHVEAADRVRELR